MLLLNRIKAACACTPNDCSDCDYLCSFAMMLAASWAKPEVQQLNDAPVDRLCPWPYVKLYNADLGLEDD